ncbi:UNVERIFIED_CONTAM: Pelargonidin 3-O-(6-caffeoylglucoside) 5-O-(6-O-malonylglucoside) 4'''-malonyltransferase [Sesamum calycinum]|uniref:Pelargonidin 3-O-(6-caffeoylglucoside) 5-O-(6-O-malonylglucoside) 4'''-malonyltransferase n=1 Tax=Sesamum calycinum TaxID=2727403 RepID=A0AAW2R6C3_9LAMI
MSSKTEQEVPEGNGFLCCFPCRQASKLPRQLGFVMVHESPPKCRVYPFSIIWPTLNKFVLRIIPPVSKYSCGTWVCTSFLESDPSESYGLECNLATMVSKMREANIECIKDCARILSDREFGRWLLVDCELEAGQRLHSTDNKVIWISDLSKFEDYELDFGFGKPIWATVTDMPIEDFIVLMNTKHNDGIEAWVYMHESDMPYLDQDEELRMLTTQRGYAI